MCKYKRMTATCEYWEQKKKKKKENIAYFHISHADIKMAAVSISNTDSNKKYLGLKQ